MNLNQTQKEKLLSCLAESEKGSLPSDESSAVYTLRLLRLASKKLTREDFMDILDHAEWARRLSERLYAKYPVFVNSEIRNAYFELNKELR